MKKVFVFPNDPLGIILKSLLFTGVKNNILQKHFYSCLGINITIASVVKVQFTIEMSGINLCMILY